MQAADTPRAKSDRLDGKELTIGMVQARFNASVTDALAQACKDELIELGVRAEDIDHVTVPGALEIAVALQALAETEKYDALVAVGCTGAGKGNAPAAATMATTRATPATRTASR